ncbi:MAG: histidinol phosphate phosphatase [Gracilibacter sp. BRH_c7a]|nr:MAG: histidinol phosphate phosphatase [Gracilibacter sp. BRH_c7a]
MIDLHVHLIGHMDRLATRENIRDYLEQARISKIRQIGFADHDLYWDQLDLPLIREVASEYPDLQVRVGLEAEYSVGQEYSLSQMIKSFEFDYIIGSVHEIGDWAFDYPSEERAHFQQDSDELYSKYFALVEKAACSGLFSIVGHFDLIKIFNARPKTDVRILAARALEAIKDNGLVVEINTNGRYKPVNEFYPEIKLLEEMKKMEIPFTLGSDAHEAKVVGRDLWEARGILKTLGVKELIGFKKQRQELFCIE